MDTEPSKDKWIVDTLNKDVMGTKIIDGVISNDPEIETDVDLDPT